LHGQTLVCLLQIDVAEECLDVLQPL